MMAINQNGRPPIYFAHIAAGSAGTNYFVTDVELSGTPNGVVASSMVKYMSPDNRALTIAAVPASIPMNSIRISFDADSKSGKRSSLAAGNVSNYSVNVHATAYGQDGAPFAERDFTLKPFEQIVENGRPMYLDQMFPEAATEKMGSIQFDAGGKLIAATLKIFSGSFSIAGTDVGYMPTSVPSFKVVDLFDNGTLWNSRNDSLLPVVPDGGKVVYDGASHYDVPIKQGYPQFPAGEKMIPGTYKRRFIVPGFAPEEQEVQVPDTPEVIRLADSRFVNLPWMNRTVGYGVNDNDGSGYNFAINKDQAWAIWCDTQAFPDIRTIYENFLRYDVNQHDPSPNHTPLARTGRDGALLNYKVGAPPPRRTPYTLSLRIDSSVPTGTVGINLNDAGEIISADILVNPQLAPDRFASELPILFGEEDNDAWALIPNYVSLTSDHGSNTSCCRCVTASHNRARLELLSNDRRQASVEPVKGPLLPLVTTRPRSLFARPRPRRLW
jgi:hypothetical protein